MAAGFFRECQETGAQQKGRRVVERCCVGVAEMGSLVVVVGADVEQIITGPSMQQRDRGMTKAVRRYNGWSTMDSGQSYPIYKVCVSYSGCLSCSQF